MRLAIVLLFSVLAVAQNSPQNLSVESTPDAPAQLSVGGDIEKGAGDRQQAWIHWQVDDVPVSFNVYRGEQSGGPYDLIAKVSDPYLFDMPPRQAFTYYYVVTEIYSDGSESQFSPEMGVSLP